MAGDRIIMVDDTLIAGVKMKNTDVMKRLRGPKNTEVRVKVLRGGVPDLIEFKITRGKIPVYSLDAAYMADKTTGYIKLNRFAASSATIPGSTGETEETGNEEPDPRLAGERRGISEYRDRPGRRVLRQGQADRLYRRKQTTARGSQVFGPWRV